MVQSQAPTPGGGAPKSVMAVVLMSLFAYPGTGHFALKEYWRGVFWVVLYTSTLIGMVGGLLFAVYQFYSGFTSMGDPSEGIASSLPGVIVMILCGVAWFVTAILSAIDAAHLSRRNDQAS